MEDLVTIDTILDWLTAQVAEKKPLPPSMWVETAMKCNVLLGAEMDKLYELQRQVAHLKTLRMEGGDSATKAKVYVEATKDFMDSQKQKGKIERAVELIRIAKLMSRMSLDEMKSY